MISIGLPLGPQSNVKMKNSIKFEAARSLARSQLLSGNAGMVDSLKEGAKEKGRIENKNKRNRRK